MLFRLIQTIDSSDLLQKPNNNTKVEEIEKKIHKKIHICVKYHI